MANRITYQLEILATSPEELSRIAARLKQPSTDLIDSVAEHFHKDRDECATYVSRLLKFESIGHVDESGDKAREFQVSFQRFGGIVDTHVREVSEQFPSAIFLLLHFDQQSSYSGKTVILGGEAICDVYDGNQRAQAVDWTLLDVFAPFRAEHELGIPFGSLWDDWIAEMINEVNQLKGRGVNLGGPRHGADAH